MSLVCRRVNALCRGEELCAADIELCAPVGESSVHRWEKALCTGGKSSVHRREKALCSEGESSV